MKVRQMSLPRRLWVPFSCSPRPIDQLKRETGRVFQRGRLRAHATGHVVIEQAQTLKRFVAHGTMPGTIPALLPRPTASAVVSVVVALKVRHVTLSARDDPSQV